MPLWGRIGTARAKAWKLSSKIRYRITADYLINLALFLEMEDRICYLPLTVSRFFGLGLSDRVRNTLFHGHKFSVISKIILQRLHARNLLHLAWYFAAYFRTGMKNNLAKPDHRVTYNSVGYNPTTALA